MADSFVGKSKQFLEDSTAELKKVQPPTRAETIQTTVVALVIISFVAISLFLMDAFFSWSIGELLSGGQ